MKEIFFFFREITQQFSASRTLNDNNDLHFLFFFFRLQAQLTTVVVVTRTTKYTYSWYPSELPLFCATAFLFSASSVGLQIGSWERSKCVVHSFGFLLRDRLLKTVVAWASAAKRQLRLVILLRVQAVVCMCVRIVSPNLQKCATGEGQKNS